MTLAQTDLLKLGTRRSLLAWAQSSWVAREVERLNPGTKVELVGIETRGDRVLDVSLRTIAGKEFFVAELDDALRSGQVDFTVHSMKDLSLERPGDFALAAIPRRENPRDVILFGPMGVAKILRGDFSAPLRIGTSSPRRIENLPSFLEQAIPGTASRAASSKNSLELVEIRGNVNTRLARIQEPVTSERYLDGVVLAFAGLIRLWADERGREEMTRLLRGARWMVAPLQASPTAPAQGALAVECRASDQRIRGILGKLHDEATARNVKLERDLLADWGGGCHQKFGGTVIPFKSAPEERAHSYIFYIRGRKPDEQFVEEVRWSAPPRPERPFTRVWDGSRWHSRCERDWRRLEVPFPVSGLRDGGAVFVAHSRAVPEEWAQSLGNARIWTSGLSSWYKLARMGVWVEGCAEGLGYEALKETLSTPVLQLPEESQWTILTHRAAADGWKAGRVIATYELVSGGQDALAEEMKAELSQAEAVFWSAGSQYDALRSWVPEGAQHACGPGKTATYLQEQGLEPMVFPSVEEWRKWLK